MAKIEYFSCHHSGGTSNDPYAKSQHLTASDIDAAHFDKYYRYKDTWPAFKSTLNRFGGYNLFYEKNGLRTQFRAIGEETAAQKGWNFNTVSICFAGNFQKDPSTGKPIESPTPEQISSAKADIESIITGTYVNRGIKVMPGIVIDIPIQNVHAHRWFQQTECYGNSLPDDWARKTLFIPLLYEKLSLSQTLLNQFFKLNDMLKVIKLNGVARYFGVPKFGALQRSCIEEDSKG